MNKEKLAKVLVILIITIGVLTASQVAIQQITPDQVPSYIEPIWGYIVVFFESAPVIIVLALGRNLLGYARNYWKTDHAESYDINRLYGTWAYYIGGITTVLAAVPEPFDSVAVAIIVLLDFVTSEIKQLM